MTTDIWNGTGDWNGNLGDWSLGVAPTASDNALIESGTVTLSTTGVADVITVNSFATFNMVSAVSLTAKGLTNFGQINFVTNNHDGGEIISISGEFADYANFDFGNSGLSKSTTMTVGSLAITQSGSNGTITLWGDEVLHTTLQTTLDVKSAAPTVLRGSIYLHGDFDLEFASGGITTIDGGVELQIDGEQSRLSIGAGTTNSALSGLAYNAGTLDLEGNWSSGPGGTTVTTNNGLTNVGALDIDVYSADGASQMKIGGELTNFGSVTVGNPGLTASNTLTVTSLNSLGTITLWGNQTLGTTEQSTLDITGAGPATITGTLNLHGDSDLEYGSGGVTTVAAGAYFGIDGAQSRVSVGASTSNTALTGFEFNHGTTDFEGNWTTGPGGAIVTTDTAFYNYYDLYMDVYSADGDSSLTIGKTLTNYYTIQIGNTDLSANTTLKMGGLTNEGSLYVQGSASSNPSIPQALADVLAAAPTIAIGDSTVAGNGVLKYASGDIKAIAAGATIEIAGAQASFTSGSGGINSALADLATVDGTLLLRGDTAYGAGGSKLTVNNGVTNNGSMFFDSEYSGDGGSVATIKGTVVNYKSFTVGNAQLSGNTTVTVNALSNGVSGYVYVQGSTATGGTVPEALLDVLAAAPADTTGYDRVAGEGVIKYASGGIQSISAGSTVEIDGADASFTSGSGGVNSALSTLTSVRGTLLLRGDTAYGPGGAQLALSGGLTNYSDVWIDSEYSGDGGSQVTIKDALVNTSTLDIGNEQISANTTVQAASLSNSGTLILQGSNGPSTSPVASLKITAAAVPTVASYTRIAGNALLDFGSGTGLTTVSASGWLELDGSLANVAIGSGAQNSGLAKLSSNAGMLLMRGNTSFGGGGVAFTTTTAFTNTGTAYFDSYGSGDGGGDVKFGGALANYGSLSIGNEQLSAATSVQATSLNNIGTLVLQGNNGASTSPLATLKITGAVNAAVSSYTRIGGNALLDAGTGSGFTSIAAGGWLELDGSLANVAIGSGAQNSGLAKLASNAGTLALRGNVGQFGEGGVDFTTTAAFFNSGTAYFDAYGGGDGGGDVKFGGVITNEGAFDVGNTGLSAATTVDATGLANDAGQLNLNGSSNIATLSLSAGAANYASVNVGGGSVLHATGAYLQYNGETTIDGTLSAASYTQDGGSTTVNGTLASATVAQSSGFITFDSALTASSAAKTFTLTDAAELTFNAAVASAQTVDFADATDYLALGTVGSFAGLIKGFADGDTIDLVNTTATSFTFSAGVMDLFDGATKIGALSFIGSYTAADFTLATDSRGGTEILDPPHH